MTRPVPPEKVSRNRKPAIKKVRMAIISHSSKDRIDCNCGWQKLHLRKKVREDAAQRHLDKNHGGQAIWL